MSEENKAYKHFWIRPRKISKGPTYNCTTNLMKYAGYTDVTHVIEYSALEQSQAEIENLKKELDDVKIEQIKWATEHPTYVLSKQLEAENEKLKKQNEIMRTALDAIQCGQEYNQDDEQYWNFDFEDMRTLATEAIKKIEGME